MTQATSSVQETVIPLDFIKSLISRKLYVMQETGNDHLGSITFGSEQIAFEVDGLLRYKFKGDKQQRDFYFCACPSPIPILKKSAIKCTCGPGPKGDDHRCRIFIRIFQWCFEFYDSEIYDIALNILNSLRLSIHTDPLAISSRQTAAQAVLTLTNGLFRIIPQFLNDTTDQRVKITQAFNASLNYFRRCNYPIPKYISVWTNNLGNPQDITKWPGPLIPTLDLQTINPITQATLLMLMKTYTEMGKAQGRNASGDQLYGVPEFVQTYRSAFMCGWWLKPWVGQDFEARKCFADICLAYGRAVGLGKENRETYRDLLEWVQQLKSEVLEDGNQNDPSKLLGMYSVFNDVAEHLIQDLIKAKPSGNESWHLKRLLHNHVPQHRARIALLDGNLDDTYSILEPMFTKLINHPTQNNPKLLLEQIFPMLVEYHIIQGQFMELEEKCELVKTKCGNQTHLPDMWLRYIEFRQDGTPIPANDPQFTAWQDQLDNLDRWNLALLLQVWGEASSDISLLEASIQIYNDIPSFLDSYLVLAKIIRLQPSKYRGWSEAKQFLRNYPLYSGIVNEIDNLLKIHGYSELTETDLETLYDRINMESHEIGPICDIN